MIHGLCLDCRNDFSKCSCVKPITDTERLDWMIENEETSVRQRTKFKEWHIVGRGSIGDFKTPREAIDACIELERVKK